MPTAHCRVQLQGEKVGEKETPGGRPAPGSNLYVRERVRVARVLDVTCEVLVISVPSSRFAPVSGKPRTRDPHIHLHGCMRGSEERESGTWHGRP